MAQNDGARRRILSPPACLPQGFAIVLLAMLLAFSSTQALSSTQAYRTISTSSPRPLAMGGAFVSVRDGLAALNWNPASFVLYEKEASHRLSVYFNPIISIALLGRDCGDAAHVMSALGAAVRAITYSPRWAELGLLLWEEPFFNPAASVNGRFLDAEHIFKHYTHTLGLRVRLASSVSLGSTGNLYKIRDEQGQSVLAGGVNYGVLLRPAKGLEIGLAYFDLPSSLEELRQDMEGIKDESVNGGICIRPDDQTLLAMDLRDASAGEKIGWTRFRFGLERNFLGSLAFRFGYFQTGLQEHDVYCFGLGLFHHRGRIKKTFSPSLSHYQANYSLLVERGEESQHIWHLLSVLIAI